MFPFAFNTLPQPTNQLGRMPSLGALGDPHEARKQAIIAQIMGTGQAAPTSVGQGAIQAASSIAGGFALRNHNRGPFPDAPGGAQPRLAQGLMNFFGRSNGGLY